MWRGMTSRRRDNVIVPWRVLAWSLVLGIVSTVVFSWGVVVYGRYNTLATGLRFGDWHRIPRAATAWLWSPPPDARQVPQVWDKRTFALTQRGCVGIDRWILEGTSAVNNSFGGTPVVHCQYEVAAGWPMHAMRARRSSADVSPALVDLERGLRLWPQVRDDKAIPDTLPLRPIPAGFAGDSLALGCIWFGVISLGKRVRAGRRSGQGRCGACAYPTRGLTACPECGQVVRRLAWLENGGGV
jgi:hypothetical protein